MGGIAAKLFGAAKPEAHKTLKIRNDSSLPLEVWVNGGGPVGRVGPQSTWLAPKLRVRFINFATAVNVVVRLPTAEGLPPLVVQEDLWVAVHQDTVLCVIEVLLPDWIYSHVFKVFL